MKKINKVIISVCLLYFSFFALASPSLAKLGVGVTTGKIQVDERLMAGVIYQLPVFTVINTGDEESDYEVSIAFRENQEEMRPSLDWFSFEPQSFRLKAGESQTVDVEINVPLKTVPGDYFCFLEGHPVVESEGGETQIGISAASKLYFTLAPSSFLQGLYYRIISLWNKYLPWTNIGGAVVLGILVIYILSKFIKIEFKTGKSKRVNKPKGKNSES